MGDIVYFMIYFCFRICLFISFFCKKIATYILPHEPVWQVVIVISLFILIIKYMHYIVYLAMDYFKHILIISLIFITFIFFSLGFCAFISVLWWIGAIVILSLIVYFGHIFLKAIAPIKKTEVPQKTNNNDKGKENSKEEKAQKEEGNEEGEKSEEKSNDKYKFCEDDPHILLKYPEADLSDGIKDRLDLFEKYIKNDEIYSIGLTGGFGKGKTTLIELLKDDKMKNDKEYIWIPINVWEYSGESELIEGIANTVSYVVDDLYIRALIRLWSKGLVFNVNNNILSFPLITNKLSTIEFSKKLYKRLEEINKKLVFIIDDIDRIYDKNQIMNVMKIYQWFNRPSKESSNRIKLIFSVNTDHLNKVLEETEKTNKNSDKSDKENSSENGNKSEKENFLNKIFDVSLSVPGINVDKVKRIYKDLERECLSKFFTKEMVLHITEESGTLGLLNNLSFREIRKIFCYLKGFIEEKDQLIWFEDVVKYYYFMVKYPHFEEILEKYLSNDFLRKNKEHLYQYIKDSLNIKDYSIDDIYLQQMFEIEGKEKKNRYMRVDMYIPTFTDYYVFKAFVKSIDKREETEKYIEERINKNDGHIRDEEKIISFHLFNMKTIEDVAEKNIDDIVRMFAIILKKYSPKVEYAFSSFWFLLVNYFCKGGKYIKFNELMDKTWNCEEICKSVIDDNKDLRYQECPESLIMKLKFFILKNKEFLRTMERGNGNITEKLPIEKEEDEFYKEVENLVKNKKCAPNIVLWRTKLERNSDFTVPLWLYRSFNNRCKDFNIEEYIGNAINFEAEIWKVIQTERYTEKYWEKIDNIMDLFTNPLGDQIKKDTVVFFVSKNDISNEWEEFIESHCWGYDKSIIRINPDILEGKKGKYWQFVMFVDALKCIKINTVNSMDYNEDKYYYHNQYIYVLFDTGFSWISVKEFIDGAIVMKNNIKVFTEVFYWVEAKQKEENNKYRIRKVHYLLNIILKKSCTSISSEIAEIKKTLLDIKTSYEEINKEEVKQYIDAIYNELKEIEAVYYSNFNQSEVIKSLCDRFRILQLIVYNLQKQIIE